MPSRIVKVGTLFISWPKVLFLFVCLSVCLRVSACLYLCLYLFYIKVAQVDLKIPYIAQAGLKLVILL